METFEIIDGVCVIPEGVTEIRRCAFEGCAELTKVIIPESVVKIGPSAFNWCKNLREVVAPIYHDTKWAFYSGENGRNSSKFAFKNCPNLNKITIVIPKSMRVIESRLCEGFKEMTEVIFHDDVERIEWRAFADCVGLTEIQIPTSVVSIETGAFAGCVPQIIVAEPKHHASITYDISRRRWKRGDVVENDMVWVVPDSVTEIKEREFANSWIDKVLLPQGLVKIGRRAFYGCKNMQAIFIPESVTEIAASAFEGCSSLMEIKVDPKNAIYDSREDNTMLVEIAVNKLVFSTSCASIPDSIERIGDYAFAGNGKVIDLEIPDTVGEIGVGAFADCGNLEKIIIGKGITKLADSVFSGCKSLREILIPENVVEIGSRVFYECGKLTEIYIPKSVTEIAPNAFGQCDSLQRIIVDAENPIYESRSYCANTDNKKIIYPVKTIWARKMKEMLIQHGKPTNLIDEFMNAMEADIDNSWSWFANEEWSSILSYSVWEKFEDTYSSFEYVDEKAFSAIIQNDDAVECIINLIVSYFVKNNICPKCIDHWLDITRSNNGDVILNEISAFAHGLILLPDEITHIADDACSTKGVKLVVMNLPSHLKEIGDGAFRGCTFKVPLVSLPSSLTKIGVGAFYGTNIRGVYIPDSVIHIGGCFLPKSCDTIIVDENNPNYDSRGDCNAIIETKTNKLICGSNSTIIPYGVEEIGDSAFSWLEGFKYLQIPDSVKIIGDWAFNPCFGLEHKDIVIPDSVVEIGDCAFSSEYYGLGEVTIEGEDVKFGDNAFYDERIDATQEIEWFLENVCIDVEDKYFSFRNEVTEIPSYAFRPSKYCDIVETIEIPDSVTSIEANAFTGCVNLKEIVIPDSVVYIDETAFEGCNALQKQNIIASDKIKQMINL